MMYGLGYQLRVIQEQRGDLQPVQRNGTAEYGQSRGQDVTSSTEVYEGPFYDFSVED